MSRTSLGAAILFALSPLWALAATPARATATLHPASGSKVEGRATFVKTDSGMHVTVHVTGLAPGTHGFHIHEFGDCSAPDATSAGGHFNPGGDPHAGPKDAQHHAGDMGNIEANADGVADLDYNDPRLAFEGSSSVLGRAVIVHEKADDLKTQPTGNAGGRQACGVIGVSKPE